MATKVVIFSENKTFISFFSNFLSEAAEFKDGMRQIHTAYQHWLSDMDMAPTSSEIEAYHAISEFLDFCQNGDIKIQYELSPEEQIKANQQIIAKLQAKKYPQPTASEGNVK